MRHATRRLTVLPVSPETKGDTSSVRESAAGPIADADAFQTLSELLAKQTGTSTGAARELQQILEQRVTNPGHEPDLEEPETEARWAPWQTTLLVLVVAGAFWGGLIWLFLTLTS